MADQVQNIPTTTLAAGVTTFVEASTTAPFNYAQIVINRTGPGNHPWLNNLLQTDALAVDIQYSLDGGVTFIDLGGATWPGGQWFTPVATSEELEIGNGAVTFPTGTPFKVIFTADVQTTISGTITYTDISQ